MQRTTIMAFLGLNLLLSSQSNAAIVQTTFTLDAASPTVNRLALTLLDGATTTDISGTIVARIDIDQTTGVISSVEFDGGTVTGTDWVMTTTAAGTLTATGMVGTTDTTNPPTAVTGTTFDASMSFIALTGGQVTGAFAPVELNGTNLEGSGNGTLTSTLNGGNFDIVLSMAIDDTEPILGQNLGIVGNVIARGSIAAVPEPSSALVLSGLVTFGLLRRKRS